MLTHEELKKKMLDNPQVKAEYDALEEEFALFDELLKARMQAGLTQAQVALAVNLHAQQIRQSCRLSFGGQAGAGLSASHFDPFILLVLHVHRDRAVRHVSPVSIGLEWGCWVLV